MGLLWPRLAPTSLTHDLDHGEIQPPDFELPNRHQTYLKLQRNPSSFEVKRPIDGMVEYERSNSNWACSTKEQRYTLSLPVS